jgi:hypothetical protein
MERTSKMCKRLLSLGEDMLMAIAASTKGVVSVRLLGLTSTCHVIYRESMSKGFVVRASNVLGA